MTARSAGGCRNRRPSPLTQARRQVRSDGLVSSMSAWCPYRNNLTRQKLDAGLARPPGLAAARGARTASSLHAQAGQADGIHVESGALEKVSDLMLCGGREAARLAQTHTTIASWNV
jgi:hypothetical protein